MTSITNEPLIKICQLFQKQVAKFNKDKNAKKYIKLFSENNIETIETLTPNALNKATFIQIIKTN